MSQVRPEYPRPQFVREDWINLNGEWNFAFDDQQVGLTEKWHQNFPEDRTIVVPFAYQTENSGIHDASFHDVVWYQRTFPISEEWSGKKIRLNFGAVDYRAWVYINGEMVTFHEGGHTPFSVDITPSIQVGENDVVVRVEDPSEDETIPRGKQYWHEQPASIFYTRTTGIWQTVWLEAVAQESIESIRWTPQVDRGDIELETEVKGDIEGLALEVKITFNGQTILSETSELFNAYVKRSYNIRNRLGTVGTGTDVPFPFF